jgi:hypothetical protein
MTIKEEDSYEALRDKLRKALQAQFPYTIDSNGPDYSLKNTYSDKILVENYTDGSYFKVPYTITLDGNVEFGDFVKQENEFNDVVNSMNQGKSLILINSDKDQPVYRTLIQTPKELPAYDMGLKSIIYPEEDIKQAVPSLLGEHVWDESMSSHRQLAGGKDPIRFGKVVNQGYCPNYGGYADIKVELPEYVPLMDSLVDSVNNNLPTRLGFSTEIPKGGYEIEEYGDKKVKVKNFKYEGLVLTDSPRDKSTGVCDVINNSITEILEEENMAENDENEFKLTREEYDDLKTKEAKLAELEPKYQKGEGLYTKGKKLYDDLKAEVKDLKEQLLPVWTAQETEKTTMVNSILKTIPKAEHETKKPLFEDMSIEQLGTIVNALPGEGGRGIADGAGGNQGSTGDEKPAFKDPAQQAQWEAAQNLPKTNSRIGIIKKAQEAE